MVRTVPPNPEDSQLCSTLASSAVHGTMAGYTGFSVGVINTRTCYIPTSVINSVKRCVISMQDRQYQRLLSNTGQPSFRNETREVQVSKFI